MHWSLHTMRRISDYQSNQNIIRTYFHKNNWLGINKTSSVTVQTKQANQGIELLLQLSDITQLCNPREKTCIETHTSRCIRENVRNVDYGLGQRSFKTATQAALPLMQSRLCANVSESYCERNLLRLTDINREI